MVSETDNIIKMELATLIQILDEAVYISHRANKLGKYMNLTFLSPVMSK